ncbi:hypothetical protein C4D60_Mb07t18590 [Musa balbisiana]|uniref:NAD-dependent epimerase/dehydratase domain-containing protein n=1 Tax=Musa balbisiana TaxID=52838 RepID=A0A4S8JIR8_MUSBA|nr:hypothetical protein C4D60_Mb07t18590 [Musa balbisiana]
MVSPVTGKKLPHESLMFLQAVLGSVPLVHIEDVCEAHVFCMERESMFGRFLCAVAYPTMQDIVDQYAEKYPQLPILIREVEGEGTRIPCSSTKLEEMGFKYNYRDAISSAIRYVLIKPSPRSFSAKKKSQCKIHQAQDSSSPVFYANARTVIITLYPKWILNFQPSTTADSIYPSSLQKPKTKKSRLLMVS